MDSLGRNITLPIYNADGTSFHGLELKKFTFDSVVMALGDKITGELYYTTNTLTVAQTEYVVYDGVKYYLINPPTIVKEGMKADNGTAKGMTKYSFTFYHPMFMLYNFPFTDVAVTSSEEKYKSQDKNFFWIGNLVDYVAKLNKNLQGTEWVVEIGSNVPVQDKNKLSEVLSFNDQKIADALKTGYDTWEIPYIIDIIASTDSRYAQGKRFLIRYGLPSQEILVENAQHQLVPYVFQMGQGVGLKNDSRTPKNNKIVTRIAGYGSEDNVPFGYPQILWTGNQTWNYTINNSASAPNSYPIYDGIVAGQRVRLIHHPFTRSHLMPTIYADTVNKKVNPYASGYDPTIEIKDYYDAVNDSSWTYPNQIIPYAPSYEIHEFSDIKPELGEKHIVSAAAFDGDAEKKYLTLSEGLDQLMKLSSETNIDVERGVIRLIHDKVESGTSGSGHQEDIRYVFKWSVDVTTDFIYVKFASSNINFEMEIHRTNSFPSAPWDDAMDDDGNYKQSYFNITLPQLDFDLYACAAVTQEMTINMRSGACLGCSFPVEVDWEDYKANFYDSDGNFAPTGSQRDYNKYPDSSAGSITIICKKEIDTFGTLMPNIYQQPKANDKFVILGISLPTSYITNAQLRLDHDMCQYMLDNNVHYFEWPLKFDEFFLANHTNILAQMKPNILVRFNFASEQHELYIKQISVKYGEKPLPQYNITLTDDIEIVLSPIGRVTDEVSSLRVLFGGGGSGSGDVNLDLLSEYFLSKQNDDTAAGMIRFLRGLQVGENFVTGLLGEGGIFRIDDDGTTYIEADKLYIRMRAYFDTVEVKKYLHSGGNRIASKAGINCSRVEWIDANGEVTNVLEDTVKFRCYFRANGENGREITNDFVVNDLAFCKETNVDNTSIQQHGYWRCVVGVSSSPNEAGEHWIDLSKSDCQSGSNIPLAQDDIIQLGHKTDNTRQGAIVEFVGGEDAPSYQIYQGINSYDLTGKNYVRFGYDSQNHSAQAYIGNPDGSTYLWYHYVTEGGQTFPRLDIKANVQFTSPITHQDTTIEDFAGAVTDSIEDLQEQIDGEIDTWFYEGTPTLNNAPASDWTTATEKERHLGDLYYDIGTGATGGFAYRFIKDENNVYQWQYLEDTAITEALAKAAEAYDLADHKRRVFYTTPTPPYDNGDLWVNAVWPDSGASQGSTYNDDILRCVTSRATGNFAISDWTLASKYTDDSALTDFVTNTYASDLADIQTQVDGKAETYYQDADPSTAWLKVEDKEKHVGDIWCDTSANGGKKTYIWRDRGVGQSNRFYWAEQAVPDVVFDEVDKKAAIYVTWNGWITGSTNNLNEKDLFIPAADTTQGGVTYKKDKVYRCIDASIPSFEEIHYTDDSTFNAWLTQYTQTITGINNAISDAQSDADAAAALAAAATYLTDAMLDNTGGAQTTDIQGGLVLTSLIALRDSNRRVMSGISGTYQAQETGTGYKGHGIAAWYGGGMVDKEMLSASAIAAGWSQYRWARTLFRFDGSGYVADGNISWDKDGGLTIKGNSITATTELKVAGSDVLTQTTADARYVTIEWFRSLFKAYNSSNTELTPNGSTTGLDSIKAMVGLWTESYLSALGQSSGGSSGGGTDMATVWSALATYDGSHQIAGGYLSIALNSYATKTWVQQQISGIPTSVPLASTGTIGGIKVKAATAATPTLAAGSTADRYYGLQIDGNGVAFVNVPWTDNNDDTKNTAGSTEQPANTQLYIVGATAQAVYGQTYSNSGCYISADGYLYSGGLRVLTSGNAIQTISVNSGTPTSPTNGNVNINVPTKVSDLTNDSGFVSTDTKNTAGISNLTATKLFLIGGTQQTDGLRTYSNTNCYIGTDNCLYSGGVKVLTSHQSLSGYATQTWVTSQGYITSYTDTKNTAGATNLAATKLFLIGATAQNASPVSYSNANCYVGTDNCLYSGGTKVLTGITKAMVTDALGYTPPTTDTNTWRTVQCNGTSIGNNTLNLKAGTNVSISASNGTLTISSTDTNTDTDTKNTAGATNLASTKLFIIGATAQNANPVSYSNSNCYIGTDNCLYSGGSKVATGTIPTKVSQLTNDSGFITGITKAMVTTALGYTPPTTDTNTWRTVQCNGTSIGNNTLNLKAGTNVSISASNGTLTISSTDTNTDTDTKNTAGGTNLTGTKLFIVGLSSQSDGLRTYSNSNCYIGTDNCLYSGGTKVLTSHQSLSGYATQSWVTSQGYIKSYTDTDTKNTVGATNLTSNQLYLVGATAQNTYTTSYTLSTCYISSSGYICCTRNSGRAFSWGADNNIYVGSEKNENAYLWVTPSLPLRFGVNNSEKMRITTNGTVAIGTTTPGSSFKFYVNGSSGGASAWANTSDVRKKNIINDVKLELWQIAQAPLFRFRWKDTSIDTNIHIGTSAQYWQTVAPETVMDDGAGNLGLEYSVVALLSAITTARKVQDHENRIQALERENAALRNELKRLTT